MNIFFDVDGVLIDGYHAKAERRRCWDARLTEDTGIDRQVFQTIFSDWETGWFKKVITGKADFETELGRWLAQNNYSYQAKDLLSYWFEKDSYENETVIAIVKSLAARKDIRIYTATNQAHERIAYLRDTLGWGRYFTDFYYSARLGCLKFDPRFFEKIEEELGLDVKADSQLYFDDDVRNIEVAAKRGWNAVLVDGPEDVTEHPVIRKLLYQM